MIGYAISVVEIGVTITATAYMLIEDGGYLLAEDGEPIVLQ